MSPYIAESALPGPRMAARGSVKAWLKGNNNVAENAKVTNNAKESKQKPGGKMANKIPGENKADLSSVFDEGKDEEKSDQQAGKKRKPNVIQGLEVQLEDSEFEEEAAVGKKKKVALKGAGGKATKGKAAAKGARVDGLTVEQHRRALGDKVKAQISVLGGRDNYGIAARCHALLPCSMAVFRALVLPNATKVVPAEFGPETEVVLAQLTSTQQVSRDFLVPRRPCRGWNSRYLILPQIAAIFGSTKIKGGTRYGSWSATSMDIVFLPGEGVARAWWVMAD